MFKRLTVLMAVILAMMAFLPPYFAEASTRKGKIAFSIRRSIYSKDGYYLSEKNLVFLLRANGTGKAKRVMKGASYIEDIEWDKRGTKFFVSYTKDNGNYNYDFPLKIFNRHGKLLKAYSADLININEPSWAFDGNSIIFGDYTSGIYKVDLNNPTLTETQILTTTGFTFDHVPILSPDGKRLTWIHHEWGSDFYLLTLILDPLKFPYKGNEYFNGYYNNKSITLIKSGTSEWDEDMGLQWSRSKNMVVLSTENENGAIYVVDMNQPSFPVSEIEVPSGESLNSKVYLSHRGKRMAFWTDKGLYVSNLKGEMKKLVDGFGFTDIAWSRGDKTIAYTDFSTSDTGWKDSIYLLNANGTTPTPPSLLYTVRNRYDTITHLAWSAPRR